MHKKTIVLEKSISRIQRPFPYSWAKLGTIARMDAALAAFFITHISFKQLTQGMTES